MHQPKLKNPVVGRADIVIRSTPGAIFDFIGLNFFSNYPRWSPKWWISNSRATVRSLSGPWAARCAPIKGAGWS